MSLVGDFTQHATDMEVSLSEMLVYTHHPAMAYRLEATFAQWHQIKVSNMYLPLESVALKSAPLLLSTCITR